MRIFPVSLFLGLPFGLFSFPLRLSFGSLPFIVSALLFDLSLEGGLNLFWNSWRSGNRGDRAGHLSVKVFQERQGEIMEFFLSLPEIGIVKIIHDGLNLVDARLNNLLQWICQQPLLRRTLFRPKPGFLNSFNRPINFSSQPLDDPPNLCLRDFDVTPDSSFQSARRHGLYCGDQSCGCPRKAREGGPLNCCLNRWFDFDLLGRLLFPWNLSRSPHYRGLCWGLFSGVHDRRLLFCRLTSDSDFLLCGSSETADDAEEIILILLPFKAKCGVGVYTVFIF